MGWKLPLLRATRMKENVAWKVTEAENNGVQKSNRRAGYAVWKRENAAP